jgi:hypothetical protein
MSEPKKRMHVVINPAAGQDELILNVVYPGALSIVVS